ncbi:hypothetical protein OSTOST_24369, partial [Ostertagia ostertagi]
QIEKTPEWNSNVQSVERVDTISEYADIIHYTTSDLIVVKGRDFVVCRMWRKVGDSYVVAATSFRKRRSDSTKEKAVLSSGIADMMIKDARYAYKYVEEEQSKKKSE